MAISTHTTTFTRRAVARLLAFAPVASVPAAALAMDHIVEANKMVPTLDEEIAELTKQLVAKLDQRYPGYFIRQHIDPEDRCAFLLTSVKCA